MSAHPHVPHLEAWIWLTFLNKSHYYIKLQLILLYLPLIQRWLLVTLAARQRFISERRGMQTIRPSSNNTCSVYWKLQSACDKSRRCSVDTAFSILDTSAKQLRKTYLALWMSVCLSVRIKLCGSLPSSEISWNFTLWIFTKSHRHISIFVKTGQK